MQSLPTIPLVTPPAFRIKHYSLGGLVVCSTDTTGMLERLLKRRKERAAGQRFLGAWRLFRSEGVDFGESVTMEFQSGGTLLYTITEDQKTQIIRLTYKVDGATLITDQPSSPRLERTSYAFQSDDVLLLEHSDGRAWFQRL